MPISETLDKIRVLVQAGKILVSAHGYDELASDGIFFEDVIDGLSHAEIVENYPAARKGRVFWFCEAIQKGSPFISYGASRRARKNRRS